MLRDIALSSISQIASNLLNAGYTISPVSGSVIEPVVASCDGPFMAEINTPNLTPKDIDNILDYIKESAATSSELPIECSGNHTYEKARAVERLSEIMQRNIKLARDGAKPIILSVHADVVRRMEKFEKAGIDLDVIPFELPSIWTNMTFLRMVEPYFSKPFDDIPQFNIALADVQLVDVIGLMKTGISDIDNDIDILVSSVGSDQIMSLYQDYYQNKALGNLNSIMGSSFRDANNAVILFLMALGLKRTDMMISTKVSSDMYQVLLDRIVEQTALRVGQHLKTREQYSKYKTLILAYVNGESLSSSKSATRHPYVLVNQDVYSEWLKEPDASCEILLGSLLTDQETGYSALLDKRDKYLAAYSRHRAMIDNNYVNNQFAYFRSSLQTAMAEYINGVDVDCFNGDRSIAHSRIRQFVNQTTQEDITKSYECIRRGVCDILFSGTEVPRILTIMDHIASKNESKAPREVATLTILEILCDWAASQYTVQR